MTRAGVVETWRGAQRNDSFARGRAPQPAPTRATGKKSTSAVRDAVRARTPPSGAAAVQRTWSVCCNLTAVAAGRNARDGPIAPGVAAGFYQ